jgi:hypothetical protein
MRRMKSTQVFSQGVNLHFAASPYSANLGGAGGLIDFAGRGQYSFRVVKNVRLEWPLARHSQSPSSLSSGSHCPLRGPNPVFLQSVIS